MGVRKNPQRGTWQLDLRYMLRGELCRIRKDFPTKAQAERELRRVREMVRKAQAAEELGLLPEVGAEGEETSTNLSVCWKDWIEQGQADGNRVSDVGKKEASLELHILPALGDVPIEEIRPQQLERIKVRMRSLGRKPATIRQVMAPLHACFESAVRCQLLERNPMAAVRRVKVLQADQASTYLDFDETKAVLLAAAEEDPMWGVALRLALKAGLRRGELFGLKWGAVDLDQGWLRVVLTRTEVTRPSRIVEGPPKSGRGRAVGLTPTTVKLMRALPSRFLNGYVLADEQGGPLRPGKIVPPFRRTLKRAGIERHVRLHDLRHTWASHMAMRGVPLAVIQELGGWASYQMVRRYAHLSAESVVRHVDVLDDEDRRGARVAN